MRQAGLWLAATALSASLVTGGPVIATATAAPGGGHGHGHGGSGHSGAGHAGGAGSRGPSHTGPGAAAAAASPGSGPVNTGTPVTSGGGAPAGVDTGGGPTISRGPGWSRGSTPPKPAQGPAAKPGQSPINGGLPPSWSSVKADPAPVVSDAAGDDPAAMPSGQARVALPDSVVPTQTVAVTVAIARTMTISLDSNGDSRSSIDTQPLSMSVPGVLPMWWATDSEDLWNGFYGFAVLVLLPLIGVGLGLCLLAGLRRAPGGADPL